VTDGHCSAPVLITPRHDVAPVRHPHRLLQRPDALCDDAPGEPAITGIIQDEGLHAQPCETPLSPTEPRVERPQRPAGAEEDAVAVPLPGCPRSDDLHRPPRRPTVRAAPSARYFGGRVLEAPVVAPAREQPSAMERKGHSMQPVVPINLGLARLDAVVVDPRHHRDLGLRRRQDALPEAVPLREFCGLQVGHLAHLKRAASAARGGEGEEYDDGDNVALLCPFRAWHPERPRSEAAERGGCDIEARGLAHPSPFVAHLGECRGTPGVGQQRRHGCPRRMHEWPRG